MRQYLPVQLLMAVLYAAAILLIASRAHAADVTLVIQSPTQNTDGTALTDLWGYEYDSTKVNVAWLYAGGRIGSFTFSTGATVTVFFPARTNAPTGVQWETNTVTGLTAGLYYHKVRAVAAGGFESADSMVLTNRVGSPGSVPLVLLRP
jgi:hypothetical protein